MRRRKKGQPKISFPVGKKKSSPTYKAGVPSGRPFEIESNWDWFTPEARAYAQNPDKVAPPSEQVQKCWGDAYNMEGGEARTHRPADYGYNGQPYKTWKGKFTKCFVEAKKAYDNLYWPMTTRCPDPNQCVECRCLPTHPLIYGIAINETPRCRSGYIVRDIKSAETLLGMAHNLVRNYKYLWLNNNLTGLYNPREIWGEPEENRYGIPWAMKSEIDLRLLRIRQAREGLRDILYRTVKNMVLSGRTFVVGSEERIWNHPPDTRFNICMIDLFKNLREV